MAQVLVVGAGPAGASLAYVLADRGIEVTLLERQRDFEREFRGEVLLSSGLEALEQLGLGDLLASVPTARPERAQIFLDGALALDFPLDARFFDGRPPAAVSQPALLEAIVAEASKRPSFRFLRATSARGLLLERGRVVGVRAETEDGTLELRADLVVGADGRASVVRRRGGFEARAQDLPMDIVWCKLPPLAGLRGARFYLGHAHLLIAYQSWDGRTQVAWAILKGSFGELRSRGVEAWVEEMAAHASPDLAELLRENRARIERPFLLDCQADRVREWARPGALLIGDAAHVMSPVGGQGLNLALRDVISAANQLVPPLRTGASAGELDAACARVQAEREPELRRVQRAQALPPRFVLARAWWGEPLRRLLALLLGSPLVQRAALSRARVFQFGTGELQLRV